MIKRNSNFKYDVAVIGAGPAGLMAAITASNNGAKVIVLEKNRQPGLKLLITGGGRCNVTNYLEDYQLLAKNYGKNGSFLLSAFSKFGPSEVVDFFENLGVKTKIEKNNQVFPVSNQSREVLKSLTDELSFKGGIIKTSAVVKKIVSKNKIIQKIVLNDGEEVIARNYILATGGKSYAATGSTGDGYGWLKSLGHRITPLSPVLSPILIEEKNIADLEGLSFSEIKISLFKQEKRVISLLGDCIFTASGLSGPLIFSLSRYVGSSLKGDRLVIDLMPNLNQEQLDRKLQKLFSDYGQKFIKNILTEIVPPKLIPTLMWWLDLTAEEKGNAVTKAERQKLGYFLKNWSFHIKGLAAYEKAMVTAGGLDLKEIDPKTMRSRLIYNLFVAGEILDLDGPTGGFNLQICWSTGRVAGENASIFTD